MKTYIILKDTPGVKAGTIFRWDDILNLYRTPLDRFQYEHYPKSIVEENTEWFKIYEPAVFRSYDGVQLHDGDPIYHVFNKPSFSINEVKEVLGGYSPLSIIDTIIDKLKSTL